ncbi:unnamed protein product [Phytophthora fragariaefolia]|uniref:Unnamed protein product n=1 Tax=Phytophthora fragariaefolia TaxID=1490495 RepID=A0A9W6X1S2_9STRA|nr:unnamed protein product [Phytophthora fragariaefolia]
MHNTISRMESEAGSSASVQFAVLTLARALANSLTCCARETASTARQDFTSAREEFSPGAMHYISKNGLLPMALLPSKFAVDYVTPRQDQAYRGTCWDFATIGFLEQSYRAYGVHKGWLNPDEYVAFSEQVR